MQYSTFLSPLGEIRMLASEAGLAAAYFPVQARKLEARLAPGGFRPGRGNLFLLRAEAYLACYFDGDLDFSPEIPFDMRGTPFQVGVWTALGEIAPGRRLSYGELASRMGRPAAVRAVAAAIGRNPLSIFVPCHRVVGADGSLKGYAGGVTKKRFLLEHERRCATVGQQALAA
ncbi:MAG: methylated-DNA--[protein]-cysteine S-methyltransferase [Bryobacterales bacterium]|nr:methylated-DNA--[protein]-cysteine S-methyltransferase [Bryobacterales bacterium]